MKAFLTEAAGKAFHDAIEDIERASAAEVVVVARPAARGSLAPHAAVAVPLAIATLAYTLYSVTEFEVWQILAFPIIAALLGAVAVAELGAVYRAVSPRQLVAAHVRDAARAMFYARGVHATTKRTGVLVYLALRERAVELVGDVGFVAAVDADTRAKWARAIAARLPDGVAAGRELARLAGELATKLPHHDGDKNELADDVVELAVHPRGRRGGAA
jgi:putative membrane protein